MGKYVVLCDCDGMIPNPRIIAWITDERPRGGSVAVTAVSRYTKSVRNEPNKRGGTTLYTIGCVACGKGFANGVTDETMAAALDRIIPKRSDLEVRSVPAPVQPEPELSEDEQQERREYGRRKITVIVSGDPHADPLRDPRWYTAPTVFEERHIIPLLVLCEVVSHLRVRGKGS
jgi:hypothetical protein